MAGSKSDFLEDKLINHVLRNTAYTSPTTVYAALYTVTPSDSAGGTEVTGGAYARQAMAVDAPSPAGETQNTAEISFPVATASWGTVLAASLMDAVTAGNLLYWGDVTPNKLVSTDDQFKFAAGAFQVDEL